MMDSHDRDYHASLGQLYDLLDEAEAAHRGRRWRCWLLRHQVTELSRGEERLEVCTRCGKWAHA